MLSRRADTRALALPSAPLAALRGRARIMRTLREFFEDHDYMEIETPLLSKDVCVDACLEPFPVNSATEGALFLQTSPEFHMKRLLAAGAERIYQVTRSFRAGEHGPRHNPEFTILEWYAVGETYDQQMDFVEQLVRAVAGDGPLDAPYEDAAPPGPLCSGPFPRVCYDDAFATVAGASVLTMSVEELKGLAARHQISAPASLRDDDRDGWLNLLLSAVVEPALEGAMFLCDFPASQAALARVRDGVPPVAERFELYLDGIEICNGYQELTDADELERRMSIHAGIRDQERLAPLPVHSRLTEAMRDPGLPECAGVALGVDRLVMWRLGAERLDEVVAFPLDRA